MIDFAEIKYGKQYGTCKMHTLHKNVSLSLSHPHQNMYMNACRMNR
jgi:hypothetical protein